MADYLDEKEVFSLMEIHKEGITSAQVIKIFRDKGIRFSEATLRKYVQLGLLPRSHRVSVGAGKHRGSRGIYSVLVIKNINDIKKMMDDGLTLDDIARASMKFKREINGIDSGLQHLFKAMAHEVDGPRFDLTLKPVVEEEIHLAREEARSLILKLEKIDQALTRPKPTL